MTTTIPIDNLRLPGFSRAVQRALLKTLRENGYHSPEVREDGRVLYHLGSQTFVADLFFQSPIPIEFSLLNGRLLQNPDEL